MFFFPLLSFCLFKRNHSGMSGVEACKCNRMVYPGNIGRKDKGKETKDKD